MAFPGSAYAPPGVFTQTEFENPLGAALQTLKIPVFIGEGSELLVQENLEVVRGSSSTIDQRRVDEDMTGRAVASVSQTGQVTLGAFNGVLDKIQVRHYPLVTGDGTGTTTNSRGDVTVTLDGEPIVVRAVTGATGIVQLAQAPQPGQQVLCTYYYNRTDTLITDDLSDQVDPDPAVVQGQSGLYDTDSPGSVGGGSGVAETVDLHGDITDANGAVIVENNNVLNLVIDSTTYPIVIPPRSDYTMAQIAAAITAANVGTLTASTFTNNFGQSALLLNADHSIVVNEGTANALLGLLTGQADARVATFYTFQGPIVDGSNGGVTTTDPSHVTVKVNGTQVIPTSVSGSTRAVTLPQAPIAGATVAITYYFNAWQDTFDYLANINVQAVTQCGDVPNGSGYTQASDFILQDDKILWGTAVTVESGVNSVGSERFDDTQVTGTLIDNRTFMSACTAVTTSSGGSSVASVREFTLPLSPTTGNGRNTPLGTSLFQTVSNGRIDLPTNRPDLVTAYWGFDMQDALDRGPVQVTKVEGNVITLDESVPVGATVFATFWYNQLTDNTYTLTCLNPGLSGAGTYTVEDSGSNDVYGPIFNTGTKSANLIGVTIEFPSGSELKPDLRYESVSDDDFEGPVEEIVTVEFGSRVAGPAKYTVPGYGPYEFIPAFSDFFRVAIRSTDISNSAGLDLMDPSGWNSGFFASLLSDEIDYTGGTGATVGQSYDVTASEEFIITTDDADVPVKTGTGTNVDISFFADAINEAAAGHTGTAAAGGVASVTLDPLSRSDIDDFYVGWRVVMGLGAAAAGDALAVTAYNGTTGVATMAANWSAPPIITDRYTIFRPENRASLQTATAFDGPVVIVADSHDQLVFRYVGDVSGLGVVSTLTLAVGTYDTPNALAAQVQTQIDAAIAGYAAAFAGANIECIANSDAKLEFRIQPAGTDSVAFLQFLDADTAAEDFAVLAGLDTAAAVFGGQATLVHGPIARTYEVAGPEKLYDRLVLRNRILPGYGGSMHPANVLEQTLLTVKSGNTKAGISTGDYGTAGAVATVRAATAVGTMGFSGGMDANGEPLVTLYDGTGTIAANDEFSFEVDGVPVTAAFTSTPAGTATPLGPASGTSNGSILDQIIDAIAAVPGAPFGAAPAVFADFLVRQEGAGIRITSQRFDSASRITIGSGSANSALGFTAGAVSLRVQPTARLVASALMNNYNTGSFADWMAFTAGGLATEFGSSALASVEIDAAGQEYLYMQDAPVIVGNLGASSTVQVLDTLQSIANALRYDTGLGAVSGAGAVGEAALDGYFVISSNPNGSGSANDSILNNGVGQDGIVGQTYRDKVTGLTFTILPRGWSTNQNGPWISYPTAAATFRIECSKTFTCDANIPHNALPGTELRVDNTVGVTAGDTCLTKTYERGGQEPAIGDLYYVTYNYTKPSFDTAFYTKISSIEAAYGAATPDNPVSLAAYLAILNGAVLVGVKQVQKEEGTEQASLASYVAAIEELEGVLPGQALPDIITPLRGDSTSLYQILKRSNEIMSSVRYRSERTSILGVSAGTTPEQVGDMARTLASTRMRIVYPDIVVLTLQDQFNNTKEYLIDGTYVAAALAGSVVSPNVDVATPWTGRRLVGFTQTGRKLDAVQQNIVATKGVTVMEDRPPYLRVRHGLTTNMANILTKIPTVIQIADEVQRQSRQTLEGFIGIKFLPGILSQIEGRLAMMMKALVAAQIISAYQNIKANVASDDPTVAEVQAYYAPVFPLLYILLTFHLRSSL